MHSFIPVAVAALPAVLARPQNFNGGLAYKHVPAHAAAITATATASGTKAAAATAAGGTALSSLAGGSGVGGTTCTVTEYAQVTASVSACSNVLLDGVTIPASSTLSVSVPSGAALLFAGTMTVEYTPDASYTPIVLKGTNAKVAGLAGAVIDGQGAKYWDGKGSNGGTKKPDHFIKLSDMESSTLEQLTIQNWPTHLFSIDGCKDMTISNVILDNSAGDETNSDGDELGHNTDAFDVSSVDGLYVSSATVYNQDDCVAVNSGSNILFENMYCSGGHGLSIGSVDSGITISNVTFQDSTVINSQNACRIKTDAGGSDSTVSDITYSNIAVSGITDYAIDVQQDYENGSPTGDPTTGITISGVTFKSITGSVSGDDAYSSYILCGSTSSCKDFTYTDIDITGGKTECKPSTSLCPS
ncbi:Endopolygalacturonase D [Cytospora mali]|uniref:endo-polygalacturonase n=1 Tax=Cytospora mali TaxID=578113 RepID=A0A194VBG7_CYTMA|nr:Endopolygalacturonase D [Valsa mali var. pyri (nom. inval.)]